MTRTKDELEVRRNPCATCPYRQDCPSGVWAEEEYDKLVAYDRETPMQPSGLFMCHQPAEKAHTLCAGWVAVHGGNLLSLRLAAVMKRVSWRVFEYTTRVALWRSGAEAREWGLRDLEAPGDTAQRAMDKILSARGTDLEGREEGQ